MNSATAATDNAPQLNPLANPLLSQGARLHLDGYQFREKIGEGGMAAVYRGQQLSLQRPVAIKVLNQQMRKHDQIYQAFEREAVIIARLNHPNIIHVIDRGISTDGTPFFIMEFVEGVDLASLLRDGQLPLQKKIDICLQLCKALSYAHKNGVIHRDIKPANILIDEDFNTKVLDFGIALLNDSDQEADTQGLDDGSHQDVMGTFNYMAPELASQVVRATVKSDVYSLGVLMYELFAGHLPNGSERKLKPEQTGLPISMASLVMRCLLPDPLQRPDMIAIVDQLLLLSRGAHLDQQRVKKANESVNNRKSFALLDILHEYDDAAVYLFIEQLTGQQLVVKKYTSSFQGFETGKKLSGITHPNIARVHGTSKNQRAYIEVMDYLKGGSLQERMVRIFAIDEFLRIARQVVRGLGYAHSQQVLHGNLHPGNIFFDESGNVKIADFGKQHHSEMVAPDGVVTKRKRPGPDITIYKVPNEPLCPQTDIYACGVIFYLMLIGTAPKFHHDELQVGRAFKRLPKGLQELVQKMLHRTLVDRPKQFAEVFRDIDQLSDAMPTQVWEQGGDGATQPKHSGQSKKPLVLLLLLTLLFLALANAGLMAWFDKGSLLPMLERWLP